MRTAQEIIEELDGVLQLQVVYKKMAALCQKKIYLLQQEAFQAMEDQDISKLTFLDSEYKQDQDIDFKLTPEASAKSRTWDELPEWREFVEEHDPGLGKEKWTVAPQTRKAWLKARKEANEPLPDFCEQTVQDTVKHPKKKVEQRGIAKHLAKINTLAVRLDLEPE